VQSAKAFSLEAGVLETFMKGCAPASDPADWCAGIGHDVERHQFEQSWMIRNPSKMWVQMPDEQTARSLEDHLRGIGLNGDTHGGDFGQSLTQVYVYRHPQSEPSLTPSRPPSVSDSLSETKGWPTPLCLFWA
jgi:hypothetical protein